MTEVKKRIPKNILNARTRDENIRIEKLRPRKIPIETTEKPKELRYTKEQIKAALERPVAIIKEPQKKAAAQYLLRDMVDGAMLAIPDPKIVEEINKSYQEDRDEKLKHRGDKRQKNLYFSNTKACPRAIYYRFFQPEMARDYTTKGLILFDDGNRHHLNLQRRLEDRGMTTNPEGYVEILPEDEGFHATGYYDQIHTSKDGNGILEIKSKFPGACFSIFQADYDQAQLYIFAAQKSKRLKAKQIKITGATLLYKDRALQNDEVHHAWTIKPDLDRQHDILEYFRFLQKTVIDKKALIPHPYERSSTACTYCVFADHCWKGIKTKLNDAKLLELIDAAELPEKEILESAVKRFYTLMKQIKEIKKDAEIYKPILLNYFLKTQEQIIPVTTTEGVGVSQGSSTDWDSPGLAEAIGVDLYLKISSPQISKINELIKKQNVDAAKFEQFKTKKLSKPALGIKKYQQGVKNEIN